MASEQKPSRLAHVPAVLAGSAAFIAAISTLYANLRNDAAPAAATPARVEAQATPAPAPVAASAPAPAPTEPVPVLLRLDRVQVDNDGSVGTTDWSFQVSVDGKPLYALPMPGLSDVPGENLARPAQAEDASARVELPRGRITELSVSGWKKGWHAGSRAEVTGKTELGAGLRSATLTLATDKPKGPRFVMYFSIAPAK